MEGIVICDCEKCVKERLKMSIDYARKYGFVAGLLRGLILQSKKLGRHYIISEAIFDKVKAEFEKLESPQSTEM
jgi:hypothetical protein